MVFRVKESIFGSFTELPCSGDLENPDQLPVLHVLEGTDDWVLWIFVIPSLPIFSGSRNPFFIVSRSYPVWMTSKIPGQLPVLQVLEGTDDWVLWIFVISSLPTFSGSRNPFFIVSRSYPVWMTPKIQINFRFSQVLEGTDDWVLWIFVITSFSTFSRSKNSIFTVSQSSVFRRLRKSK